MSQEIEKSNKFISKMNLSKEFVDSLIHHKLESLEIGDIFIVHDSSYTNDIYRVEGFEEVDYTDDEDRNKNLRSIYRYVIYRKIKDWNCEEWEEKTERDSLASFYEYRVKRGRQLERGKTPKQYYQEALDVINGKKSLDEFKDQMQEISEERALIHPNSKELLKKMQSALEEKQDKVSLLRTFVSWEMEKHKAELEKIRKDLGIIVADLQKKVEKIMRVITSIELYLGIKEDLFQIQEGVLAPQDTPISFRQQVLYMDEEIGIWENGGLDHTDLKKFDEWLIKDEKYKALLPEEKGVLVFRPRRGDKEYYRDDWRANVIANIPNKSTYLLIRNGENLYRIFSENIQIFPRLFPKRAELAKMMEEMQKEVDKYGFEDSRTKEKIDDKMYQYKIRAILLQGLIDRSEVFHPLPKEKINIFNLDEAGDSIRFIYDDEATLPSGRKSFKEWQRDLAYKIDVGSRIIVGTDFDEKYSKHYRDRFARDYWDTAKIPDLPGRGMYDVVKAPKIEENITKIKASELEEWKLKFQHLDDFKIVKICTYENQQDENFKEFIRYDLKPDEIQVRYQYSQLSIYYNPEDTIYNGWRDWRVRKNRLSFIIKHDDSNILNYDAVSLDDVEFYLTSRVDRENYLHMMPTLIKIKEEKFAELASEKDFVQLVKGFTVSEWNDEKECEDCIWNHVQWWKLKNKYKRPIAKDDTKALRMIIKAMKKWTNRFWKDYVEPETIH